MGVEPTWVLPHTDLNRARLPFRHFCELEYYSIFGFYSQDYCFGLKNTCCSLEMKNSCSVCGTETVEYRGQFRGRLVVKKYCIKEK